MITFGRSAPTKDLEEFWTEVDINSGRAVSILHLDKTIARAIEEREDIAQDMSSKYAWLNRETTWNFDGNLFILPRGTMVEVMGKTVLLDATELVIVKYSDTSALLCTVRENLSIEEIEETESISIDEIPSTEREEVEDNREKLDIMEKEMGHVKSRVGKRIPANWIPN